MFLGKMQALWGWRQRVERRLGRFSFVFPLLSLLWGVVSAVFLTRDYAHSSYLAASLGFLIVFSIFLKLWFLGLGERWEMAWEAKLSGPESKLGHNVVKSLVTHISKPKTVEDFALQVNQTCIQYITMFCIPLLYAAEAWGTLVMTIGVAGTTLWDRWWRQLAMKTWYTALIRGCGALLACSYGFAVLFPRAFTYFYPVMGLATLLAVLPWSAFFPWRKPTFQELGLVAIVMGAIIAQVFLGEWIRVPVLSVWVRKPAFGLDGVQSTLKEKWPRSIPLERFEKELNQGRQICCLTPVVSPSGMISTIAHEWLINGNRIDYVPLGRIRSTEKTEWAPYRTLSCKQNFPPLSQIKTIECRVYLDDTVDVGGALLKIKR